MANEQNLIPRNFTKEEAKKYGKIGARKSAISRRKKRKLADRIKLAMEIASNQKIKNVKKEIAELWPNRRLENNKLELRALIERAKMIRDSGYDVYKILSISEYAESDVALRALNSLWDREEGKPNQSSNIKHEGSIGTKIIRDDIG